MEPRRAFRFGVVCARGHSRHDWWEKARKAEQLGYATFLVPDHLQDQLAPVPALLAAADATTPLRIRRRPRSICCRMAASSLGLGRAGCEPNTIRPAWRLHPLACALGGSRRPCVSLNSS